MIVIGGIFLIKYGLTKSVDANNCPPVIETKTVFLFDYSELVSIQTRDEIIRRTKNFLENSVKEGDRVSLFHMTGESKQRLSPIFDQCRPQKEANELIESKKIVDKKYQQFIDKIVATFSREAAVNSDSPIAQAIFDLSLSDYLKIKDKNQKSNLVIFSDLMEHTHKMSLYGCADSEPMVDKFKSSRIGMKERPDFKNVTVYLHVIPRVLGAEATVRCRDYFWNWFFGNKAAGVSEFDLPGGF